VHGTGRGVEVEGPTPIQGDRSGVAKSRDVTGVEAEPMVDAAAVAAETPRRAMSDAATAATNTGSRVVDLLLFLSSIGLLPV
jgi:hypothetical protein